MSNRLGPTLTNLQNLRLKSWERCHNPIFEQIIKKLNIVDSGVKTIKFEVWGCNLRVNWSILKELKVKDLIKG
jgi:hypothetical protein